MFTSKTKKTHTMAMPLGLMLGLQTGGNLLNSWMTNWQQGKDRDAQNAWNAKMWEANKRVALQQWNREAAWNLKHWHRQNEYNLPIHQMQRMKDAGLNPHLMYGKGTPGNAAPMGAPSGKVPNAPQAANVVRGIKAFGDFADTSVKNAQTNNLEANTNVSKQEAILKAVQAANEAIKGKKSKLDYGIAKELRETSINAAKTNLEKLSHETKRSEAEAIFSHKSKDARVEKIKQELRNLIEENNIRKMRKSLMKWELELKEYNLTPQDNALLRLIHYLRNKTVSGKVKDAATNPFVPFGGLFRD